MRSRPDLDVYLSPDRPHAGSRLRVEVVLRSHSQTPIDGVSARLRGLERRVTGSTMAGDVPVMLYANATHVDLLGRTPAAELTPGEHRFALSFDLPPGAPPAYKSSSTNIEYELSVEVLIPWWPDRSARYTIPVRALPSPGRGAPATFCTSERGPADASLYIETSVDSARVARGGVLGGAVSLANVERHRIRRVDLGFVGMEVSKQGSTEVSRYTTTLTEGAPADSAPIPFRAAFPAEATPSFRAGTCELRWVVEVRAVIALGTDRVLTFPIEVVEPGAPEIAGPAPARTPPVGRERRALIWAEVARLRGLDLDAEEERLSWSDGRASLSIGLEPQREGGFAVVARVSYPHLGIGLSVGERRWTNLLSGGAVKVTPAFDARFHTTGREEAQVRAFLDEKVTAALLGFERVTADDRGATLQSAGAAQSAAELDAITAEAQGAARALGERSARVPPPAAMASMEPAWRAFAALASGRLHPGDMSIRDAVFDGRTFELVTTWGDEGAPAETRAQVFLPPRDRAEPRSRAFEAIAAEIAPRLRSLAVERGAVVATLGAPIADPREALPVIEALARLAAELGGEADQGPYR